MTHKPIMDAIMGFYKKHEQLLRRLLWLIWKMPEISFDKCCRSAVESFMGSERDTQAQQETEGEGCFMLPTNQPRVEALGARHYTVHACCSLMTVKKSQRSTNPKYWKEYLEG